MDSPQFKRMTANSAFLERELSERDRNFEIVQTHISYVILSSRWAYKIKKSLELPFLDFTDVEQRHYYCHKELDLNRRLAPHMYLSVLPVKEFDHQLFIGDGTGDTIDYALKMKRMDNQLEMDRMLQSNTVLEEHIVGLASYIADFHAKAAIVYPTFSLLHFQQLFNPITELIPYIQKNLGRKYANIVTLAVQLSNQFLEYNLGQINQRKESGMVRDVHGDLHCKNIFLTQPPTIFDCIEFDSSLRQIDMLDEIAFLAMDLEAFNHYSLAELLYQQYVNQMASHQLTQVGHTGLFAYYKMYRANVRAKVLAFQSQSATPARKLWKEVKVYLDLIDHYSLQLKQ